MKWNLRKALIVALFEEESSLVIEDVQKRLAKCGYNLDYNQVQGDMRRLREEGILRRPPQTDHFWLTGRGEFRLNNEVLNKILEASGAKALMTDARTRVRRRNSI